MKIIVLTPVRNESWILERFLSVTSHFADHIIIIDQHSTDGSLEIYKKYPKVIVLKAASESYDEAERQLVLIAKAREIVPGPKILLALDADEILAANAIHTHGWQSMLNASPGTVLYFEKPDLYLGTEKAIRYNMPWPLGYVDDGVEHKPVKIHSIRIPQPPYAKKLFLNDIKILHYALTRIDNQKSKMRFYSMTENLLHKNNFLARRRVYSPEFDYVGNNSLVEVPGEWFENWEKLGIDMTSIEFPASFWYDEEALKLFKKYGYKKFWLDNVWNMNWNAIIRPSENENHIKSPPVLLKLGLTFLDRLDKFRRNILP